MLRSLGIKIAVISNASLIWDESVREELTKADWVSVKVDALDETDLAAHGPASPSAEA